MAGLVPAIYPASCCGIVGRDRTGHSPEQLRRRWRRVAGRILFVKFQLSVSDRIGMPAGWVYIMANKPFGTLYVGVTNDLARRAWEHRTGIGSTFTQRYNLRRLVYAERHEDIRSATQRETSMKRWPRAWKLNVITEQNPHREDLYKRLNY